MATAATQKPLPVKCDVVIEDVQCKERPRKKLRASNFKQSFQEGGAAETRFALGMQKDGWSLKRADIEDDMWRHIDFYAIKPDVEPLSIDVKAAKRLYRQGEKQYEWVWIELHGVNAGNDGWLIGGKASCIAFESEAGFELFDREKLKDVALELIDQDARVTTPTAARYCIYQRAGRKDKISLVEISKLKQSEAYLRTIPCEPL